MDDVKTRIAVIGAGLCSAETAAMAEAVGALVARRGAILYCGGLGGVMEAAAKGAASAGGVTVGILPGAKASDANPYIQIPVVTGMGHARNVVLVRSCQAVISIGGSHGTLSEIALALKMWKPVVGLHTWENLPDVHYVTSPEAAVAKAFELIP
ncbi:TIGR00725 family protein [Dissulfurirhabdus thermomarina]|uniref:TIGR00725 family protein n=1 Tax=Dissulfurirhabdus thermomarina TaxID=1765737 RepID=A0A6N9TPY7_DISTH|nr:TIGR00725 family protein [Dissulfurirhabdus thermomarina]NDY43108.1 TIGR00725 family protein [Dissulfurirhabdus thermomarina]NMX24450.1 TIGR00725 family protein [Dissulfurirhabdus thermomarina]